MGLFPSPFPGPRRARPPVGSSAVPSGRIRPAALALAATALAVVPLGVAVPGALAQGALAQGTPAQESPCSAVATPVGAVQGSGDLSAMVGRTVTVRGTVVGDHEGPSPALRGFSLQGEPDGDTSTSDGLFVFHGNADTVALGETVQVTGVVSEYHGQTQVSVDDLRHCPTDPVGSANRRSGALSASVLRPTSLRLPVTSAQDLERLEGMLVRLPQRLYVTEHYQLARFGQVVVTSGDRLSQPTSVYRPDDPRRAALQRANDLDRLIVDDGTNVQNPDPIVLGRAGRPLSADNTLRGGDVLRGAVGVLTYTWGGNSASPDAFRLRAEGALGGRAVFAAGNPRPAGPVRVGPADVRVASANVLNYFDSFGAKGCRAGVDGEVVECRGARNAQEFARQAAKTVAELASLDADVVAVLEMENDGYGPGSALQDLVDRLNAAQGAGTWDSIDVDTATGVANAAGTDAIKNAILYRPGKVAPVPQGTWTERTSGVFQRPPVAQSFRTRRGAVLTVVANHFKSKGSCPAAGDTDGDTQDGQGCWNATRVEQAHALEGFVRDTVVPGAQDPDVLILGDLNSYAQEDPVVALREAGYTDLVRTFAGSRAYSYVFDGQWGYLDHALASRALRGQVTGAAEVHLNADEPSALDYTTSYRTAEQQLSLYAPDRFRSSDHDPLVIGLRLRHQG